MTPLDFLAIALSALTLHRIWNYEAITASLRGRIDKWGSIKKPLLCPACNAFWWGVAAVLTWYFAPFAVCATLAAFMPMRMAVWGYAKLTPQPVKAQPTQTKPAQAQPEPLKLPGMQVTKRRVVIMTALRDFEPSYSIATAVLNQALAIGLTHPTWEIQVWVMQGASEKGWDMPPNVVLRKVIPEMPFIENITSEEKSNELTAALLKELRPLGPTTIITHDLMFVTWYALFAHALHKIGAEGGHSWLHVPHSMAGRREGKSPFLTSLPVGNHRIVTVAEGAEAQFAAYYQTSIDRVSRIPNIKDPRSWGTMSPRVRHIVTATRLWDHDWVQIFPICTTRLEAKGFSKVVRTFAILNEQEKAFLLVCNPNAGGERSVKILAEARNRAADLGIASSRWAFTSDLLPGSDAYALNADELKSLMYGYGNLLIFPSMGEADSLIIREAQLANQLTVGNSNLPTLQDADMTIPWGTTDKVDEATCRFAANRLFTKGVPDKLRRKVLRERNLEGIGNQWGALITTAGPTATP